MQSLLGEVEDLLDPIDPAALVDDLQDAIDDFQATLADELQTLFAPVRDAVSDIIENISDGVDSFDPADIIAALQDAIEAVAGVLEHPEVLSAMNAIRDALDQTAQALDAVSFSAVTDPVIAEIDKLTAIFEELDTSQLSTPLQLSLTGSAGYSATRSDALFRSADRTAGRTGCRGTAAPVGGGEAAAGDRTGAGARL